MLFLSFLLTIGIILLILSGLIFFAAWLHKDTGDEFTPIDDLLEK